METLEQIIDRWDASQAFGDVVRRVASRISINRNGCWDCSYSKDTSGYPQVSYLARMELTHRVMFTAAKGIIPAALQLDHLCRNRSCCNPAHLEAVTSRENTMRGDTVPARNAAATHCPHGHPRTQENTFASDSKPGRQKRCRTCHIIRNRAHKERIRSAT